MKTSLAVFCASHLGRNPEYAAAAQELGRLMAAQGRTLVYGGSDRGYMGTVSTAALDGGARVIGIIPTLFSDEVINSQPRAETILVSSMQERKSLMMEKCDGFIALPGGIGTLDEVSEVLMTNQLGLSCKPMGLLNVCGFFDPLLQQIQRMIADGLICPGAEGTLLAADTPQALLAQIDAFVPDPRLGEITAERRGK